MTNQFTQYGTRKLNWFMRLFERFDEKVFRTKWSYFDRQWVLIWDLCADIERLSIDQKYLAYLLKEPKADFSYVWEY